MVALETRNRLLRQTIYILTLFFLTTSCGDRPTSIDDHSHALVDSINVAAKNISTEKLPDDWSDFYYCDNLDSAIKYPEKVHHLQLRNYDIKRLPDDVTKFSKIEEIQLLWCYNFDWTDVFNKLSKLKTLRILEIKDYNRNTLPKEISKLKSLKEIIIQSDSSLTSIGHSLYASNSDTVYIEEAENYLTNSQWIVQIENVIFKYSSKNYCVLAMKTEELNDQTYEMLVQGNFDKDIMNRFAIDSDNFIDQDVIKFMQTTGHGYDEGVGLKKIKNRVF